MDKKELIYKSAVKVIAREGFDNTKIQMIAEDAGIAVGTIYLYYRSKEEILENIICREHRKRVDFLEGIECGIEPAIDKLKKFLQYHLDTLIQDSDEGKILVQEAVYTGYIVNDATRQVTTDLYGRLYKIIEEAQTQGSVRKMAPQFLLAVMLNSVKGFLCSLTREGVDGKELPETKLQAINFILKGLKN